MEISHEELITILNEAHKYDKMKEDIRTIKGTDESNKEKNKKNWSNRIISENSGSTWS